jgi:hypothetical protein
VTAALLGMKMFCYDFLGGDGGVGVCTRCVDLHVIAEKMKIHSYRHVVKIP